MSIAALLPAAPLRRSWGVVLLVNACLMTIEIVASHLLAPFIGVSIIAWASVIGVVFVAMALGYHLGGRIVDRYASHKVLSLFLLLAAIAVALMPLLAQGVGVYLLNTSLSSLANALCLSAVVLSLPSVCISATYPCLVKRSVVALEASGQTVGGLNAAAAIGSIFGTFMSGFVWLVWFSVPNILYLIAGILALLALSYAFMGRAETRRLPAAVPEQQLEQKQSPSLRGKKALHALLAFISGFVMLSLEVVASRALAPYIGVSLYTWTGIIGMVLVGMSLGNIVGGKLADRASSQRMVGRSFAWAGVMLLLALYMVMLMGPLFASVTLPLALRTVLFTALAFLAPTVALATLSPQLMKGALADLDEVGLEAGSLSAWNTLGGLVGALSTGFVLISLMGTRGLLGALAVGCLLLGIMLSRPSLPIRPRLLLVVLACFGSLALAPRACLKETQYYCIQLLKDPSFSPENPAYILRLDHLVHSYVYLNHPETLGYGYEQVYAHLIANLYTSDQSFSSLFIGGGGYVLPRYINARYPKAQVTVSEIDPGVTEVNKTHLALPANASTKTENIDARMYLARRSSETKFDLVFGDAFNDFSVPYHLTTVEFHRLLKAHMSQDGVYALNIIDDPRYGQFLSAMLKTLGSIWRHVYVAPGASEFVKGRNTIVLLASDKALDPARWQTTVSPAARAVDMEDAEYRRLTQLLPQSLVDAFQYGHPVPLLTDQFVPLDRYLAPVFADAY